MRSETATETPPPRRAERKRGPRLDDARWARGGYTRPVEDDSLAPRVERGALLMLSDSEPEGLEDNDTVLLTYGDGRPPALGYATARGGFVTLWALPPSGAATRVRRDDVARVEVCHGVMVIPDDAYLDRVMNAHKKGGAPDAPSDPQPPSTGIGEALAPTAA